MKKRRNMQGGAGIMDYLMTVVNIFGIAATTVALKQFTPLPFWACFIIAFPLFLGFFWAALYLFQNRRPR